MIAASDTPRIARAILTNQLAKVWPGLYVRLTRQTGRGAAPETATQIAGYFHDCFDDYFRALDVLPDQVPGFLLGKRILEYGPGDVPGVGLLMLAHGAERIYCVDRFPMVTLSAKNQEVLARVLERLPAPTRRRGEECFREPGNPASGFRDDRLHYIVNPRGLSGLGECVDVALSRAVLEHVNDLAATFRDMYAALRPGGIAIHKVDLRSHGLHRSNPLDFLIWSEMLWSLMYSGKGVPNRLRVDRYRAEVESTGFELMALRPTERAHAEHVAAVRKQLAPEFRHLSDEDLAWLGFWLLCRKR